MPAPSVIAANVVEFEGQASNFSGAVNCGSDSDRLLLLKIVVNNYGAAFPLDVCTYNGVALTVGTPVAQGNGRGIAIARLVAPATGSNTLAITWNGSQVIEYYVIAEPWKDVDQATPLGTQVSATGAASPATLNVSSTAGNTVTDVAYCEATAGGPNLAVGASQTEIAKDTDVNGGTLMGASSYEAGGGTVTMSWTLTNANNWAGIGVEVNAAAVAASPKKLGLTGVGG